MKKNVFNCTVWLLITLAACSPQKTPQSFNGNGSERPRSSASTGYEEIIENVPCKEFLFDAGNYLAGFGIGESLYQNDAKNDALKDAQAELLLKFIGSFEKGFEQIGSDLHDTDGKKLEYSRIRGGVREAAEGAINNYSRAMCLEFARTSLGMYKAYYVIHVADSALIKASAESIKKMSVDFQSEQFFKILDDQLKQNKGSNQAKKPSD